MKSTQQIAAHTRWYRKWHRWVSIIAIFFLTIIAITGLLLAWKKNSGGYLLANTHKGSNVNANTWISIAELQRRGIYHLKSQVAEADTSIDRIDIRPEKGMAKITFKHHYTAVQIDLTTGRLLLIEKRRADFIEHLHDGSLIDRLTGVEGGKLAYSTLAGCSLLFLSLSGFWLWYNPHRIKKQKSTN